MKVVIFHGYLLRGTGSNIYNASLARALVREGHEVHLLCQERHTEGLDFVDGERCTVHVPDIGAVLPVYVADRYEGFEAIPFPELSDEQLDAYLGANVAAVREVTQRHEPDVALANHLVMAPAILARALEGRVPYAIKVHGSALEYTVRPNPERFLPYALEGLAQASAVLVGSRHTAESLWEVTGDPDLPARTRLGPPGVDVHAFRPRPPEEARRELAQLAERVEAGEAVSWGGESGAAEALRSVHPGRDRIVSYVGKLIVSKGVDLLVAAWPRVVQRIPEARLLIVGFGTYRDALERMVRALAAGDLDDLHRVAEAGRELEGGPAGELRYLRDFLDRQGRDYVEAGRRAAGRIHLTGRLEHDDLASVLPACEAQVMPSTFPEAFGMVAAEAAACGTLPLSAAHSGMAEVTAVLAPALEEQLRPLLSFTVGPRAVDEIAEKLVAWLSLEEGTRERALASLAERAAARFGWETVARGVLSAALGRLDDLPVPPDKVPAP